MSNQIDDALNFHQTALGLRAYRQQLLASNIANADTPNYKARDIDFKASLQGALGGRGGRAELYRTSPRHMGASGAGPGGTAPLYRGEMQSSVDGNTVNLDVERAAFAENAVQYEASLTFVTQFMRNMQSALQASS
jgi:flagellar basal-body rod protein FlgB